jgi:integrase
LRRRWIGFQSLLAQDIDAFLAQHRALGKRFKTEEAALRLLDAFLVEERVTRMKSITDTVLADFFASRPRHMPRSFNHLVGVIERLFDWLIRQDRLERSPLTTRHRRRGNTRHPFIFDRAAARKLLDRASRLTDNPRAPRRGAIYRVIFGLLYALGLRVGEVVRLQWRDVDFERRALVIRETKFGKTRLVPFGPRVEATLRRYREAESGRGADVGAESPVFSFLDGRPINPSTISQTFHALVPKLDLDVPDGVAAPRLHDLRHSFAVGTLLRWYRSGIDAGSRLLHLATFLGHVDVTSTSVYLTMTTELLDEANRRFHRFVEPSIRGALS